MQKIIIIGGKGSALVVAEQIYDAQKRYNNVEFLGFAFDDVSFGKEINGFPILCKTTDVMKNYGQYDEIKFIFQLYRPDLMKERIELLNSYNIPKAKFGLFIHPSAIISKSAKIGYGCAIMANVVLNPNSIIGNHCTIHSNSLIGHDTSIGNYNFIAAHNVLGSSTKIGDANFFGLNSTFNNYLTIGDFNFVGMGSNVIKGFDSNNKLYGNPAKPFTKKIKPL